MDLEQQFHTVTSIIWWSSCIVKPAIERGWELPVVQFFVVRWQVLQMLHLNHLDPNTPISIVRATVNGFGTVEAR